MKIVVDGYIYQRQARGGISRIYTEMLPRMCDHEESLNVTLLTEGPLMAEPPSHPRITHRTIPLVSRCLRPGRLWRPLVPAIRRAALSLITGPTQKKVWHSTYYTLPDRWKGPRVITVYDMIHERFPNLFNDLWGDRFRRQKGECIRSADVLISISHTTREDIVRFYGIDPARIHVVPLAASPVFRRMPDAGDEVSGGRMRPFLLYIGDRGLYKNFAGVLDAYCAWPRSREVDLVVVGRHWCPDEEMRLADMGLDGRVRLLTGIDDEHLCRLYNQAFAFVYPSLYEGFGIPLLEAMVCGCPVIASRIPSTVEVAGEWPVYFDPGDRGGAVDAFERILAEGRDSQRTLSGLEQAKEFSWERAAAGTLNVYRELLDN
ncbi:MAG: glycosyltransferase family 4 protein [bacterium]